MRTVLVGGTGKGFGRLKLHLGKRRSKLFHCCNTITSTPAGGSGTCVTYTATSSATRGGRMIFTPKDGGQLLIVHRITKVRSVNVVDPFHILDVHLQTTCKLSSLGIGPSFGLLETNEFECAKCVAQLPQIILGCDDSSPLLIGPSCAPRST